TGRGEDSDDDHHPLYFARLQWNFLGKEVPFSGSDVSISETPMASIGFGSAWNRSRYTRFSTSGGSELSGFEEGVDGQYSIKQHTVDATYFYAGFNGQGEYHEKEVTDRLSGEVRTLRGYYLQGGYFFHQLIPQWPKALEVAARYARFTPDSTASTRQYEHAVALNWFISGHNNKITADATRFNYEEDLIGAVHEWRYRLQWDISF
ncbi:porin, partial [Alteromonas sp. 14N.309.X.WAT.G.H12]